MVLLYLLCSSVLMFLFQNAAVIRRDENQGMEWTVLAVLGTLVTILRICNLLGGWLYRKSIGKKLTISELAVFDGAMFLMYGILAGLGHTFRDAESWCIAVCVGIPLLVAASASVWKKWKLAIQHIKRNIAEQNGETERKYIR